MTHPRPDPCFLTVPRMMRKEVNYNTTQKPLEFVYKNMVADPSQCKEFYKKELADVEKFRSSYNPEKLAVNQEDRGLKKPKDRLREMQEVKKNMEEYKQFKEAHALASKRHHLIKTGWKNGVTGIDSVLDKDSIFFKDMQAAMIEKEMARVEINERNKEGRKRILKPCSCDQK